MRVQYKTLGEIRPYENNPRNNENAVEYVARSIEEFGFLVPILLDKDNTIIAGHTRYHAAEQLGYGNVPCIAIESLTNDQVNAFRLIDNKSNEIADWDYIKLAKELENIEIDMESFDFSALDEQIEGVRDDDYEMAVSEEPKAKYGELYQLGRHRLMCGDSTVKEDMKKLIGGNPINLLLTDPPYNVDYVGATENALTTKNDNMTDEQYGSFLNSAFRLAYDCLEQGASFYSFYASTKGGIAQSALEDAGLIIRQNLIWVKNSFAFGRQDYQWKHEPIYYGWKEGAHSWYGGFNQSTVLEYDKPTRNAEHPTMKPVELIDRLMQNSTKQKDNVLDLFGGSGTTLIVAEQNNRTCLMMEYDPRYTDVIINRWETLTGETAKRIG